MGLYEIMLIIRPDLEPVEEEEAINGLTGTIEKLEGKIGAVVDWRTRRLAYDIDKHQEGHYFLVYFGGDAQIIPELEHYFRVNDAFIRYLVARVEETAYENAIKEKSEEAEEKTVSGDDQTVESSETAAEQELAVASGNVEEEPGESL